MNESGYVSTNGVEMYYESRGSGGTPLVALHGGLGSTSMFDAVADLLAAQRRVITIDLRGHGRTADGDQPFSWHGLADDVAGVVTGLGLGQVDLFGYSLGGLTSIQTSIRHPEVVRKLVVVSAPCHRDGWLPDMLEGMSSVTAAAAEFMQGTPMYDGYLAVAPKPEDFGALLDKSGQLLRTPYDWRAEVPAIVAPTMIIQGDADGVSPAASAEFFALLGGGLHDAGWDGAGRTRHGLAILPGLTHYETFASPVVAETALPFLDRP